jgi:asparagine synthase (glutamine-hydrolysing)
MCGIAGIISRKENISNKQFHSALSTLEHRGPEDREIWEQQTGQVVFGHQRLCVIDPGKRSRQPFHYMQRYVLVHNGEIYNYIELKKELEYKGYAFSTTSDTEVIAAAFAAWGKDCLQKFDGQFAFAIWDEKEKYFFAARDRMGEKPFYFSYSDDEIVFASEMKALWAIGIAKEVNESMLYNFVSIGYTSNPFDQQETFYNNIYKLPPASSLSFSPDANEIVIEKYWQVYTENKPVNEKEVFEEFEALLNESVRLRLRSDVAIGTSLSGGLDSSSIVALCNQHASGQYTHKAFTAVFPGFEKDESKYAKLIAKQYQLEHYLVTVDSTGLPSLMDKVMYYQEEPFTSSSVLAQFKVFEEAKKQGVTVLLDGQGADEILAGYTKYYRWYWRELYRQKTLSSSTEFDKAKALGIKESFTLKDKAAALFPQFAAAMQQSNKKKKAKNAVLFDDDFVYNNSINFYYSLPAEMNLNSILHYNSCIYGLPELLQLADRNSMAHATEVRLPFLNHQLVEFLFSLPPNYKIRDGWTKWLLRKTMDKKLPAEITWRKDKTGFEPPQKQWMEQPGVADAIHEGKKLLVEYKVLKKEVLNVKVKPHDAYAVNAEDWRYWTASYLFR